MGYQGQIGDDLIAGLGDVSNPAVLFSHRLEYCPGSPEVVSIWTSCENNSGLPIRVTLPTGQTLDLDHGEGYYHESDPVPFDPFYQTGGSLTIVFYLDDYEEWTEVYTANYWAP